VSDVMVDEELTERFRVIVQFQTVP